MLVRAMIPPPYLGRGLRGGLPKLRLDAAVLADLASLAPTPNPSRGGRG